MFLWFQAGLIILALILSYPLGVTFENRFHWEFEAVLLGCCVAPLMFLFAMNFDDLREQASRALGRFIVKANPWSLLVLAILIGVSEELLFRGVLQPYFMKRGLIGSILITNIIFGALHAVSLKYAVVAGLLGVVLSLLAIGPYGENLLRPIVAHALYDYLAFLWMRAELLEQASARKHVSAQSEDVPRENELHL